MDTNRPSAEGATDTHRGHSHPGHDTSLSEQSPSDTVPKSKCPSKEERQNIHDLKQRRPQNVSVRYTSSTELGADQLLAISENPIPALCDIGIVPTPRQFPSPSRPWAARSPRLRRVKAPYEPGTCSSAKRWILRGDIRAMTFCDGGLESGGDPPAASRRIPVPVQFAGVAWLGRGFRDSKRRPARSGCLSYPGWLKPNRPRRFRTLPKKYLQSCGAFGTGDTLF